MTEHDELARTARQKKREDRACRRLSPWRLILLTALAIFAAEVLVMETLELLPVLVPSPSMYVIVDATLSTLLMIPVLYVVLYRPMSRSIEEHARALSEIHRLALHDPVTSLPNRGLFNDRLTHAINDARRRREGFALILVDIDRFKEINDTLGHQCGDALLCQVGARLVAHWRCSDTVARFGADEFGILLPGVDLDAATVAAEKLLETFSTPFTIGHTSVDVDVHCGIALYPEHGDTAALLMRHADVALNDAKDCGDRYAVYAANDDAHSVRQLTLFGELRSALQRGELVLYFQPKMELKNDAVADCEALIRWRHPTQGLIAPGQFLPLAERTSLIKPLTEWVIDAALSQMDAWKRRGISVRVAVNLSARNLADVNLPDRIADLVGQWRADPSALSVEVTESALMFHPQRALQLLQRLRDMGIALSIDDFGTGYGSLTYLRTLPVQELKIDQSFVRGVPDNPHDTAIVRAVIDLAHNLGVRVIAEGVETESVLDQLRAFGCDQAQGYFIGRPMPADEFVYWLECWESGKAARPDRAFLDSSAG